MICVECNNPGIDCLYSEFKSKYIKLTICPKCGQLADKYIEFDNVIIFLDVLLLEKQAYRHLAYNKVETAIFSQDPPQYRKIVRYVVLLVLFEVYLTWAYEEKKEHSSMLMSRVLSMPVALQYAFFIIHQMIEQGMMFFMLYIIFTKLFLWGNTRNQNLTDAHQKPYYMCVLLVTFLLSTAVRCLPIIMLIWPYDNALVASGAVNILVFFCMVEGLRINTGRPYLAVFFAVAAALTLLVMAKETSMCFWVSLASLTPVKTLLKSEWGLYVEKVFNGWSLIQAALNP